MPDIWGLLAKAQDNAQTINEAITAAIVAHEADSNAHLGSGESLEAHKTSEVIDHAANSIVADKFGLNLFSSKYFFVPILSLDLFDIISDTTYSYLGEIRVKTSTVLNNIASIISHDGLLWYANFADPLYVEFTAKFTSTTTAFKNLEFRSGFLDSSYILAGFRYESGTLYAETTNQDTFATTQVTLTGITIGSYNNYAIKYIPGVKVEFYINGSMVAAITTNLPYDYEVNALYVEIKNKESSGGYCNLNVGNFVFSNKDLET